MRYLASLTVLIAILALATPPVSFAQDSDALVKVLEEGRIARNNDRFEQGIAAYEKALEMTDRSPETLLALADMYNRGGKNAEASTVAQELADKASEPWLKAGGYCQLGIAEARQGHLEASEAAFRKAIAAQPDVDTARLNLVRMLTHHGNAEAAEALVSEIPAGPMRPYVDWRQGFLGEHKEAVRVQGPNPGYPAAAGQQSIGGRMSISADVDLNGEVSNVQVVKGLPAGLSESGVKAVTAWRMKAATLDGRPVAGNYEVTFLFSGRNMH